MEEFRQRQRQQQCQQQQQYQVENVPFFDNEPVMGNVFNEEEDEEGVALVEDQEIEKNRR